MILGAANRQCSWACDLHLANYRSGNATESGCRIPSLSLAPGPGSGLGSCPQHPLDDSSDLVSSKCPQVGHSWNSMVALRLATDQTKLPLGSARDSARREGCISRHRGIWAEGGTQGKDWCFHALCLSAPLQNSPPYPRR